MFFKIKIQLRRLLILVDYVLYCYYFVRWYVVSKKSKYDDQNISNPRIIFGFTPIINNAYWSDALRQKNYKSHSLVEDIPTIYKRENFNLLALEMFQQKTYLQKKSYPYKLAEYVFTNSDILVTSFHAFPLYQTRFWKNSIYWLRKFNVKVILSPYGNDAYDYLFIKDQSLQHVLLSNQYQYAFKRDEIYEHKMYWQKNANFIVNATMTDGMLRWDALPVSMLCVDLQKWRHKLSYSNADGVQEAVNIAHAPNHRFFKGTEFIVKAIEELKSEGLKINFTLFENKSNDQVKDFLFNEADILIEQIIFFGYGLNGIEGMATGLPVMSNFETPGFRELFMRYSYLGECPSMSTTPETLKENLRFLIQNPALRKEIGIAARKYVEKYHSNEMFADFFSKIISKVNDNKEMNLMNYFNPVVPQSYNNSKPKIQVPIRSKSGLPWYITDKT